MDSQFTKMLNTVSKISIPNNKLNVNLKIWVDISNLYNE